MAIDLTTEAPISLDDARHLPIMPTRRGGNKPGLTTLYRWSTNGIRGVKLETVRCGGTLCTSEAAIARFFAALTDGPAPITHSQKRSDAARQKRRAAVERACEAAGI